MPAKQAFSSKYLENTFFKNFSFTPKLKLSIHFIHFMDGPISSIVELLESDDNPIFLFHINSEAAWPNSSGSGNLKIY